MSVPNLDLFNDLSEHFVCPICLGELTAAHITSCGHNFCEQCIRESLNRRHRCPICLSETTAEGLVKNHSLDSMFQLVKAQKSNLTEAYVKRMINNAHRPSQGPVPGPPGGLTIQAVSTARASPIEEVFQKHVGESLVAFQQHYTDLEQELREQELKLQARFEELQRQLQTKQRVEQKVLGAVSDDGALELPPAPLEMKRKQSEENAVRAIADAKIDLYDGFTRLKDKFDRSSQLLVNAFDQHLSSIPPSPFLLPVKLNIVVEPKGAVCQVSLRATESLSELQAKVCTQMEALGNPISDWGKPQYFVRGSIAEAAIEDKLVNQDALVAELQLAQGSTVVIRGLDMLFHEDRKLACFKSEYVPDGGLRTDYYRCEDCKMNWVCSACSTSCHKGHNVSIFMQNHQPSYGCCYCAKNKKKKCTIYVKKATTK